MCFLIYLFFNICTLSKSLFRGMEVLRSWVESNFDLKDRVAVERALGHSPYRRASVRYPPLLGGTVQRSVVLRADKTAAWGDAKTKMDKISTHLQKETNKMGVVPYLKTLDVEATVSGMV